MGPEKAQIGRLSQTVWAKGFSPQPWHWLGLAQLEPVSTVCTVQDASLSLDMQLIIRSYFLTINYNFCCHKLLIYLWLIVGKVDVMLRYGVVLRYIKYVHAE